MSLTGALNSAVSALKAQSTAIAMISDNLANSSTYGYKTTSPSFASLVTGATTSSSYSSGGVIAGVRSNIADQGQVTASSTTTNMAISGNGFFPVSNSLTGSNTCYTRNGQFAPDDLGYLVNNGYYLLGWRTDAAGNVIGGTDSAPVPINVTSVASSARATSEVAVQANLPADADIDDTFTSTVSLYDSLGTAHSTTVTWTKTAENTWTADFDDPTNATTGVKSGTISGSPITVTFSDGALASISPSPATIGVSGWTSGASNSSITIDLGEIGGADGLTQYDSGLETPAIDLDSIDQDGMAYGKLESITIDDTGTVIGSYSNDQQIALYKVPVATFTNPNGLSTVDGGVYVETSESGGAVLHESGTGGAGTVTGSALEASTTDTSTEFTNMIAAQQAYSAAAQIMTAVDDMFDTLMSSVR
ncbi:flagellar hook protein FlgE [Xanthobacteraceae bacterium Astr-EGSB]|uniref:flagellar hook protein FlgE n=1 Tax=Astrobacterium formosum TaxID=3069710 RepID=UPI0027B296A6|nr:flagellar hook protein FlgE [Xanthobacteraceae bacterium Astr-EGSB]